MRVKLELCWNRGAVQQQVRMSCMLTKARSPIPSGFSMHGGRPEGAREGAAASGAASPARGGGGSSGGLGSSNPHLPLSHAADLLEERIGDSFLPRGNSAAARTIETTVVARRALGSRLGMRVSGVYRTLARLAS